MLQIFIKNINSPNIKNKKFLKITYDTKILHKDLVNVKILSFANVGVCLGIGGHIQYLWCDPL